MDRDRIVGALSYLLAAASLALLVPLLVGKPFWSPRSPAVLLLALSSAALLGAAVALRWQERPGVPRRLLRVFLAGTVAFGAALAAFSLIEWRWPSLVGAGFPAEIAFMAFAAGQALLLLLFGIRGGAWWKLAGFVLAVAVAIAVHVGLRVQPRLPDREVTYLDTSLAVLKVVRYRRWVTDDDARGGAIAAFGDGYVVAGGDGGLTFFREAPDGAGLDVKRLAYRVPANEQEFTRDARRIFKGAWPANSIHRLRVGDLLVQRRPGGAVRLFVAHHYWKQDASCYVLRVSVLEGGEEKLFSASGGLSWKSLFETHPCLALNTDGHRGLRFGGLQLGGALALLGDNELLLTVGDHEFDGWTRSAALPQDAGNSYGKIVAIRIDGGASRLFSVGHRNPEGLYAGPDGVIWSTEHGPRGGDELNRVLEGANYGWPVVTYGTDYSLHIWPFNPVQGRHDGFAKPVLAFVPSIAVSAVIGVEGARFPAWRGDLLVASMLDGLRRVRMEEGRVVLVEPIRVDGRLRDLAEGNDGKIALWTDDNHIIILEPASASDAEATVLVCAGCHTLGEGEPSSRGPNLHGVFGRRVASAPDYDYSRGLEAFGGRWTRERLDRFIAGPRAAVPGTTMEFEGIVDPDQRRRIVDYLERLDD